MSELGHFALLLGFFLSSYAIVIDLVGSWRKDPGLTKSARNATIACFAWLSVAMLALWVLLIKSDFAVTYVADHTSRALPLEYKISALWAGAPGSLLLWLWMQVGFVALVFCKSEHKQRTFSANARVLANLVSVFFLIILIKDKNPFALSSVAPEEGAGLNPLLQHPAMVLHPPILFVGYAGFLIPFAWAFAWLKANPRKGLAPLFKKARQWALIAWLFLTAGIVLGAWWAYEELGWGGYWAWDPVENSSLMPWLTATALLHCFRTYKVRSSMATWTMVLSSVTFSLCVFGRFLTKYGLVSSVHAFPDPGLGILYMVLLVHVWVIAAVLMIRNYIRNKNDTSFEPVEANTFAVLSNWLFMLLTFVIFVGTLFPFLSKVFISVAGSWLPKAQLPSNPISLTPAFFTKITAPAGLTLLLLLALCPYLFRRGLKKNWRTITAAVVMVLSAAVWLLTCGQKSTDPEKAAEAAGGIGKWLLSGDPSAPCFILSGFIIVNLIADFIGYEKKIAAGGQAKSKPRRNLRWYGARVVHLGVAMMFIGIAGSSGYDTEVKVPLTPGQRASIPKYEMPRIMRALHLGDEKAIPTFDLTFDDLTEQDGPNFTLTSAHISVYSGGKLIANLKPGKASYGVSGKSISEIDVRRTLASDLYVALTGFDPNRKLINLRIMVKPLINWIWIGGIVMVFGTLAVLISPYTRRKAVLEDDRKGAE